MTDEQSTVRGQGVSGSVSAPAGAGSGGRSGRLVPVAVLLLVALVASLVFTIWFGVKLVQGFVLEQDRSGAVSAARDVAMNFTTYDVGTVEADAARLREGLTPGYGAAFADDQKGFLKGVHDGQVRSSSEVTEAGLLSYDPAGGSARVLVTVRATITNKQAPEGQARDYRMEITMVDRGDWLADRVEFVQ